MAHMRTSSPKNLDTNPTRSGGGLDLLRINPSSSAYKVGGALAAATDMLLLSDADKSSPPFEGPHSRRLAFAVTVSPSPENPRSANAISGSCPVGGTPPSSRKPHSADMMLDFCPFVDAPFLSRTPNSLDVIFASSRPVRDRPPRFVKGT